MAPKVNRPKLVRDKIPKIITDSGKDCRTSRADVRDYPILLHDKMIEELTEFMEDPSVEEAADMWEVFLALIRNWNIDLSDVIFRADDKRQARGSFRDGIVLHDVFDN